MCAHFHNRTSTTSENNVIEKFLNNGKFLSRMITDLILALVLHSAHLIVFLSIATASHRKSASARNLENFNKIK
jgi:hypothetical protein